MVPSDHYMWWIPQDLLSYGLRYVAILGKPPPYFFYSIFFFILVLCMLRFYLFQSLVITSFWVWGLFILEVTLVEGAWYLNHFCYFLLCLMFRGFCYSIKLWHLHMPFTKNGYFYRELIVFYLLEDYVLWWYMLEIWILDITYWKDFWVLLETDRYAYIS